MSCSAQANSCVVSHHQMLHMHSLAAGWRCGKGGCSCNIGWPSQVCAYLEPHLRGDDSAAKASAPCLSLQHWMCILMIALNKVACMLGPPPALHWPPLHWRASQGMSPPMSPAWMPFEVASTDNSTLLPCNLVSRHILLATALPQDALAHPGEHQDLHSHAHDRDSTVERASNTGRASDMTSRQPPHGQCKLWTVHQNTFRQQPTHHGFPP